MQTNAQIDSFVQDLSNNLGLTEDEVRFALLKVGCATVATSLFADSLGDDELTIRVADVFLPFHE